MKSAEIRQHFLDFFKNKGHHLVPSAPIVIKNDPTLLFTNAGMNQFKEYFLGISAAPWPRVADTQKCLRVSGKHNDLEEVGVDTYHHTMFEMLGNWSFGNAGGEPPPYFKEEAIAWAWELLTKVYKIPESDLYVTVFGGDEKDGLPPDIESLAFWKKWVPEDRILLGNKKDNFWEMGDTGPCGPSTEVHVDCRSEEEKKSVPGAGQVNRDNPQVIEIWNIVFIQYNRKKDGSLEMLPARHVDTGMGFERLVRVLQRKNSNYDTDVFSGTIAAIEKRCGKKYDGSASKEAIAFRVISDHIRAIVFAVADGQLPSNTGAGYVIRRILRRAVRYYFSYLEVKEPLLYQLVPQISAQFKDVFPGPELQKDFIQKVVHEEEINFLRTLEKGLLRFEAFSRAGSNDKSTGRNGDLLLPGEVAFELYDTYGFPLDLTKLISAERGLQVDEAGFQSEMARQKDRSRAASVVDAEDWVILNRGEGNGFVGYDKKLTESRVLQYRKTTTKGKEVFQVVLDQTPFYAESGGQVGDRGELVFGNDSIPVVATRKENELVLHFTERLPSDISGPVTAKIDVEKRDRTAVHHSATHLLHAALRKVLGTHVQQKGSLVNEDYLRFDFSHFSKMTTREIEAVEAVANEKIRANIPVVVRQMPREEALKTGAMALFGEKYGDMVRVVTMSEDFSIELCGGTHVGNTGELGIFKITTETAVGAGVRRIEAVCGKAAEDFVNAGLRELSTLKEQLKFPKDSPKALEQLVAERDKLQKQVGRLELQLLQSVADELTTKAVIVNGTAFVGAVVEATGAEALKKLTSLLQLNHENCLVVLAAAVDDRAHVVVSVDEKFIQSKHTDAVDLIKETVAPLIKGGGGGQKTLASAGGKDISGLQEVIQKVRETLS